MFFFDLPDVHFLLETRHSSKWIQRNWLFLKSFYNNFLSHMKSLLFIGMGNYLVQRPTPNPDISRLSFGREPNFWGMCLLVCLEGQWKWTLWFGASHGTPLEVASKAPWQNDIFPVQPGDAALGCWGERRKMAQGGSKTQPLRLGRWKGWDLLPDLLVELWGEERILHESFRLVWCITNNGKKHSESWIEMGVFDVSFLIYQDLKTYWAYRENLTTVHVFVCSK